MRRTGFSLIELLIVLAIIAALVSIAIPLSLNAIRKAKTVALANDLKVMSSGFMNYIYLEEETPEDLSEIGNNINSNYYGAAYKEENGDIYYLVFSNKDANFETLKEVLSDAHEGVPYGIDSYVSLNDGLSIDDINKETVYYSFLSENDVAPLTPLGSTYLEISGNMTKLINNFYNENGKYPRGWGEYQYTDIGLVEDEWELPYDHIIYSPGGNRISIKPEDGYKFVFETLEGKTEVIKDTYNWVIWYNIGDDSLEKGMWYWHNLEEGYEIDINTLKVLER